MAAMGSRCAVSSRHGTLYGKTSTAFLRIPLCCKDFHFRFPLRGITSCRSC